MFDDLTGIIRKIILAFWLVVIIIFIQIDYIINILFVFYGIDQINSMLGNNISDSLPLWLLCHYIFLSTFSHL